MYDIQYIPMDKILCRKGGSRSSIYAKMNEGLFPTSIKIGERKVAWLVHEIDALMFFYMSSPSEEELRAFVKNMEEERLSRTVSFFTNWLIEPDLSVKGLTYRQWKVDYDPLCDECIARGRTHDLLRSVTELIEETRRPSIRHDAILKKMGGANDHASFYWYGKIPVVMVEPYGRQDFEFDGIEYLRLPDALAPYGTCNGHETQSLLCVHSVNKNVLDQIQEKISEALPSLPDRYSVSEEERDAARKRDTIAKGGK